MTPPVRARRHIVFPCISACLSKQAYKTLSTKVFTFLVAIMYLDGIYSVRQFKCLKWVYVANNVMQTDGKVWTLVT